MENEQKQIKEEIGKMHKRREKMADGERWIIYYTFSDEEIKTENEVKENV